MLHKTGEHSTHPWLSIHHDAKWALQNPMFDITGKLIERDKSTTCASTGACSGSVLCCYGLQLTQMDIIEIVSMRDDLSTCSAYICSGPTRMC